MIPRHCQKQVFICYLVVFLVTQGNSEEPKKPNIKVTNMGKCDAGSESAIPWSFEMRNSDSEGHKIVDGEFDFTNVRFTEDLEYALDVDKYNDGDWEENVYNNEGNLCDLIKKYVPAAWERMLGVLEPKPMSICNAQQGIYKLKDFEILKKDVQIPPLYGKIRATLNLFDDAHGNIFCSEIELEISDD